AVLHGPGSHAYGEVKGLQPLLLQVLLGFALDGSEPDRDTLLQLAGLQALHDRLIALGYLSLLLLPPLLLVASDQVHNRDRVSTEQGAQFIGIGVRELQGADLEGAEIEEIVVARGI